MMNACYDAAAAPWCYPAGDAPADSAAGDTCSFADLIAGYSTDDLFELVWKQGGGAGGASASSTTMPQPPAASCRLWSPPPPPEAMRSSPPSEVEMAAWLCAIFRGDEEEVIAVKEQVAAGRDAPEERPTSDNTSSSTTTTGKKEKLPTMGSTKQAPRKLREALAGFPRRSHHGQAHKLTEKRRRHKINERFRTLQQLVPGCDDKSNQAATLDKTIQYMKSLQQHVQAMSDGGGAARRPTVVYPVVPPVAPAAMSMRAAPAMVLATGPTVMVVPLGGMLQVPHYPAAAVPLMMPGGAGSSSSGGQGNNRGGSSIRSLRQKHLINLRA